MKKLIIICLIALCVVLTACGKAKYEAIPKGEHFIASVNILQPSIDFLTEDGQIKTTWALEESYTGATIIGDDAIMLYGNQLEHADIYRLSTGKQLTTIKVKKGITNAYYNKNRKQFYITNGEFNTLTAYDEQGEKKAEVQLGLYPMAMIANEDNVFVVNFKDTYLSVLDEYTLKEERQINIPKSSHGMDFIRDELWVGGHGAGEKPNSKVRRIDPKSGELIGDITLPIMPIAFAKLQDREYVLSHGESVVYELDAKQQIVWQKEIGSNPFAIKAFQSTIVVAGYDDNTLYFVKDHTVIQQTKVGKGPFQLLVREVK